MKNKILLFVMFLSFIPKEIFGTINKMRQGIFDGYITTIDWIVYDYTTAIQFIVITCMLAYPSNIDNRLSKSIFFMATLDLIHLILLGKQGCSWVKLSLVVIGIIIIYSKNGKRNKSYL